MSINIEDIPYRDVLSNEQNKQDLLFKLIDEVKQDLQNRIPRIRENFINNVKKFMERSDRNTKAVHVFYLLLVQK